MDDELARLFEAHVRYEVHRWRGGAALHDTVAHEVAAAFDWLETTSLRELVPVERAQAWARGVVVDEPLTDAFFAEIEGAIGAARQALLREGSPLSAVLSRERCDDLVSSAVGLRRLRREVVGQLTESAVYAKLISHVLYHGVKSYVLTENAVVRRVPGASSLLRMGQSAVRSATPNLEAGIDRRLVAFVGSNVADTVHESRQFLEELLDDAMLRTVAEEIWAVNGPRAIGELAAVLEEKSIGDFMAATAQVWPTIRSSAVVNAVIDAVVERFYASHGNVPVGDLLADLGITKGRATDALATVAAQLVPAARDSGQLEAYVRRRLEAFYSSYSAGGAPSG